MGEKNLHGLTGLSKSKQWQKEENRRHKHAHYTRYLDLKSPYFKKLDLARRKARTDYIAWRKQKKGNKRHPFKRIEWNRIEFRTTGRKRQRGWEISFLKYSNNLA